MTEYDRNGDDHRSQAGHQKNQAAEQQDPRGNAGLKGKRMSL
jgi:hypothetical protein